MSESKLRSVELFTGAGGLAMGITLAGFAHEAVIERNPYACETIMENQRRGHGIVSDWQLFPISVEMFDYGTVPEGLDLLAGGPPCQPFSIGGKHGAHQDVRDMFPQAVRAVRELRPRAFIFENVKGLTRQTFAGYFGYILLQLAHPELERKPQEDWERHLARLEWHDARGRARGLRYEVTATLCNAADYGVPPRRERVFIVGFRCDQPWNWTFPAPTHSAEALLVSQWIKGDYWRRHGLARPKNAPKIPKATLKRVKDGASAELQPWRTVRDAIADLPDPRSPEARGQMNHVFQPGARSYAGHTGSPLDEPSKTLKAGAHGVPGGENMLRHPNGSVRYFTIREAARIQTFPDEYFFPGCWTEAMRQLGNAVPVELAHRVTESVRACLLGTSVHPAED